MSFLKTVQGKLEERDNHIQKNLPYFVAFNEALERTPSNSTSPEADQQVHDPFKITEKDFRGVINALQTDLFDTKEKLRNLQEEQYLKTRSVQALNDEILALTMRLNLSETKRKNLQDELGL